MNFIINLIIFVFLIQFSFNQKLTKEDCKCKLNTNRRIIGGEEAVANSIPFMASLADRSGNDHWCGATIINHEYVVTAGHCVNNVNAERLRLRVGLHYLNDTDILNKTYTVEAIYKDPHHISGRESMYKLNRGDFALLKLAEKIPFSRNVQPACLPTKFEHYDEKQKLLSIGWGVMQRPKIHQDYNETYKNFYGGPKSNVLKQAYFKYDKCYENKGYLDYQICVDSIIQGDSSCYYDSGSPLIYQKPNSPYFEVIGVTKHSQGFKNETDNSVTFCIGKTAFSRISHFMPFVNFITRGNYCTI